MNEYGHYSVLLNECLDGLEIKPNGIYVDGTLGMGGHSIEIAKRLTEGGRLISIDRDLRAIERAKVRLADYLDRITLVHANFREISAVLDDLGIEKVDGMLFDLGVSSPQLDEAERGFSYMEDAPLDMRMNETDTLTAKDVINTWEEARIKKILFEYGEEKFAPRIASEIAKSRQNGDIQSTLELVDIIKRAMPAAALREKQHPAKRSFQAIRIAVNDELGSVSDMLDTAMDRLNEGGILAVISFHSLEDRLVKVAINSREKGCTCPRDFPVCVCGFVPSVKNVSRKPITASEKELDENPRSRSAKLRIARRI